MLGDFVSLLLRDRWFGIAIVAISTNLTTSVNMAVVVYVDYLSFTVYWVEIVLFAALLGAGVGALAAVLSAASLLFFLIPPLFSLRLASAADTLHFGEFIAGACLAWAAGLALRRLGGPRPGRPAAG